MNPAFDLYWKTVARLIRVKYLADVKSRLKINHDFTLLCDNCMGGEIYNDLGLRFTSPTINMHFQEYDFLKFIKNLHHYLDCDLSFIEADQCNYPVAKLDDIILYFDHFKSPQEAEEKWNHRKRRINFENIFVCMNDLEMTEEQFQEFLELSGGVQRKLMFTTNPEHAKYDNVELIQRYEPYSYVRKYAVNRLNGFRDFEKFFDYVAWLNGEEKFMLE